MDAFGDVDIEDEEARVGVVAAELAAELPGLCLRWAICAVAPGPSSSAVRARLRELSDRRRGADIVALRTRPLPAAYRAFLRQIGLDPDTHRIPAERVALRRLTEGGLTPVDRITDACVIATAETAVGVWALDAAAVAREGPGIRLAGGGEPGPGSLIVADTATVHAPLFGEPLPGSAAHPRTRAVVLFTVGVPGVPELALHEALWQAREALGAVGRGRRG